MTRQAIETTAPTATSPAELPSLRQLVKDRCAGGLARFPAPMGGKPSDCRSDSRSSLRCVGVFSVGGVLRAGAGRVTKYVVLKRTDGDGAWAAIGPDVVEATSDVQAIKVATGDRKDKAGTFVAVPVRSFRPRTRVVETKEVDRWS